MRDSLGSKTVRRGVYAGLILGLSATAYTTNTQAADTDLVKRGEYLATAGDCVACHTAPGGKPFAGGLIMKTPVGGLSTPNLTPDKETGIGNYSDDQFVRAMHEGINAKGEYLYPAFPFPWYTQVSKDDALAIKAYLFSLKAEHAPRKEITIGFPFNIRTGLLTWRTLFFKSERFKPDPKQNQEYNRGAYLVEGLGHCGECHNRSKLLGASVWSGQLKGGQIEGYYAPNISADGHDSAGLWKKEDIVAYLKTGIKPDKSTVAKGPMKETIDDSLSKLNDADLGAIATYLKSVGERDAKPGPSKGQEATAVSANAYLSYCASCHQQDGKGINGKIPSLAGNGSVTAGGPQNVIQAVLGGLQASHGLAPMPALGQTMTDAEVADAVNYVRKSWGNNASQDTGPGEVAKLRENARTMLAMNQAKACIPVKDAAEPNTKLPAAIDGAGVKDKLEKMNTADMLSTIDDILPAVKKAAPDAGSDQITNALTAAYCPIAMKKVAEDQKSIVMGQFATLVYGQAVKKPGEGN